jgi:hypothetical protein
MADPLSVTGSAVGIVSLGLTVCKGLSDFYASVRNSRSDVIVMCDSVEALSKTLTLIQKAIGRPGVDNEMTAVVRDSIASCEAGVERLQMKLVKIQNVATEKGFRSLPQRMQYPFKESTLVKLKEVINDDLMGHLGLVVNMLHL